MYYRLDEELAQFLNYLYAQIAPEEVVVVLTSDHGTSPSYDAGIVERDRFNAAQFQVIVNSFLCAQHGPGEWVVDYEDNNLYLNHTLIYNKGLDLAAIQNEAATFAMQFRGVSHALSSTAMRSSYFGSGYGEKMQNPPFGRRGGQPHARLHRGAAGRAVEIGIDVRLRHYRAARPLRRRHPRPQGGTQRRHDLRRPDAGLPARHSGAGRFGGHGFGRIQKIEDSTNG